MADIKRSNSFTYLEEAKIEDNLRDLKPVKKRHKTSNVV